MKDRGCWRGGWRGEGSECWSPSRVQGGVWEWSRVPGEDGASHVDVSEGRICLASNRCHRISCRSDLSHDHSSIEFQFPDDIQVGEVWVRGDYGDSKASVLWQFIPVHHSVGVVALCRVGCQG